jgi:hypothetical protein
MACRHTGSKESTYAFPDPFQKILTSQALDAFDDKAVILLSKTKSPSLDGLVLMGVKQ